jgi:D-hydroxyproline dehydrogenase subunit gamma
MFSRLEGAAAASVTFTFEGQAVTARPGESVAAALLLAGVGPTRTTPARGRPRAPYCLMGVCFDCLMVIDGEPDQQACMIPVREGMRVARQAGARERA